LAFDNLIPSCVPIIIPSGNFDHILNVSNAEQHIRGRHEIILLAFDTLKLKMVPALYDDYRIPEDITIQLSERGENKYNYIIFIYTIRT